MLKIIKQKGFTLIEILLVLGIATVMSIAAVQASKREGEQQLANAAATQMLELSSALNKQISRNYAAYSATPRTTITVATLQTSGLLPTFYANRTPFGGNFSMEAVSTGGSAPSVIGLITTTPWTDPAGNPRYDLLGSAIRKIGAQGGVTYYSTNTVSGLNAGWSAVAGPNPSEFTYISSPGQLALRTYADSSSFDGVYLRRDGALPMLGNLDMGFHDINNAVNISANGWVYANHIASNDATLGSIFSNYIRNTGGIDTAQITGIGNSSTANFEYLTARTQTSTGKLLLVDVVVEGNACPTTGLVSKDANGQVLSCQTGMWKKSSQPNIYRYKFTSSGTWTVPTSVKSALVSIAGGGAGGGGGVPYFASGASAGFLVSYPINLTPGEVIPITIGAGGGQNQNGGPSSFGSYITCGGGTINLAGPVSGGTCGALGGNGSASQYLGISGIDYGGGFQGGQTPLWYGSGGTAFRCWGCGAGSLSSGGAGAPGVVIIDAIY